MTRCSSWNSPVCLDFTGETFRISFCTKFTASVVISVTYGRSVDTMDERLVKGDVDTMYCRSPNLNFCLLTKQPPCVERSHQVGCEIPRRLHLLTSNDSVK
jgi:hypothetical protein